MTRRRRRILAAAGAVAVLALVVFHRREPATERFDGVVVRHGELRALLRESGELAPRDPVLVKVPFRTRSLGSISIPIPIPTCKRL